MFKTKYLKRKEITSSNSLYKSPSFNGKRNGLWKERMRISIEWLDYEILKAMKNDPFVPRHKVNDVVINKKEDDWTK